jgi:hypothetical protein
VEKGIKLIKHIVFIKFNEEKTKQMKSENIIKIKELLEQLPSKIKSIVSLEVGIDFSYEERAMDLSLLVVFENKKDLEDYAINQAHQDVVTQIKKVASYTKVVDYIV